MSPKVSSHKQHRQRCPRTKLALKKNLRRSSIFDKKAETSDIILVENSTETSSSSGSVGIILNSSPIVISDSESDNLEEAAVGGDFKRRGLQKTAAIEDWIKNVNLENENGEVSRFSEMSGILSKGQQGTSVNSTFCDERNRRRFDELFQPRAEKYNADGIGTNSPDKKYSDVSGKSVVEDSFKEFEEHRDIDDTGKIFTGNEDAQTPWNKRNSGEHTSDGKISMYLPKILIVSFKLNYAPL